MKRRPRWAPVAGGLAAAGAGIGLATGLGALADDQRSRDLAAYALGTLPFAALLGAAGVGARRAQGTGAWRAVAGVGLALLGAAATAWILAAMRFRALGSEGLISIRALPFTREGLMLVGLLPALAIVAVSFVRRGWGLARSVAAGAVVGLLAGPVLLVSAALGALPLLDPLVVTGLVLVAAAWIRPTAAEG